MGLEKDYILCKAPASHNLRDNIIHDTAGAPTLLRFDAARLRTYASFKFEDI